MSSIQIVPKSHETALAELDKTLVPGNGAGVADYDTFPGFVELDTGSWGSTTDIELVPGSKLLDAVSVPANNITYAELQDVLRLAQDISAEVRDLQALTHLGPKKNAANFATIAQNAAGLTAFLQDRLLDKIPVADKSIVADPTATAISRLPAELLVKVLSYCRPKDLLAARQVSQEWFNSSSDLAVQRDAFAIVPKPSSHYWTPFAEPQFDDTRPLKMPRDGFDGRNTNLARYHNRADDPQDIIIRDFYTYPFPGVEYNPFSRWLPAVRTGVGNKIRIPAITDDTISVEISIWPLVNTTTDNLRIGNVARRIQLAQPPITALRGFNSGDRTGATMTGQGLAPGLNIATGITIGDLFDDARARILGWPNATNYTDMTLRTATGYRGDDGVWVTYLGEVRLNATDPIMTARNRVVRLVKAAKAKRRRQRVRGGDPDVSDDSKAFVDPVVSLSSHPLAVLSSNTESPFPKYLLTL